MNNSCTDTTQEKKPRRMNPFSRAWERAANELARSWCQIIPCNDCGSPRVSGYKCGSCGGE